MPAGSCRCDTDTANSLLEHPPDRVRFTAEVLRAARDAGWTVSELRVQAWQYLVINRRDQLFVYKLVGPRVDGRGAHFLGHRTVAVETSALAADD